MWSAAHQQPLCQEVGTQRLSALVSGIADDLWHLCHEPEQYRQHAQREACLVLVTAAMIAHHCPARHSSEHFVGHRCAH